MTCVWFRPAVIASFGLLLAACPGEPGGDGDGTTDGSTTNDDGDTTNTPPDTTTGVDATEDEDDAVLPDLPDFDTGDDTDGGGECPPNALGDGGFEGGSPNDFWDEGSDLFGTPLCDASCGEVPPYSGDWFAWYGGTSDADYAYVGQNFTIDSDTARLSFYFEINAASGTGDDFFTVYIDDEPIFFATEAETAEFGTYTQVLIDVSAWADNTEHYLSFEAETFGGGLTNFLLDEIELGPCDGGMPPDGDTGPSDTGGSSGSDSGSGSSGSDSGSGSETDTSGSGSSTTGSAT